MTVSLPNEIRNSLVAEFTSGKRFIVTTHINPDADAIGSACACKQILELYGAQVTIVLPSECAPNLLWIPGAINMVVWKGAAGLLKGVDELPECDTIIVLDLSAVSRLQSLGECITASPARIINIDHHTYPEQFAHIQWVDTSASSTCQMLSELFAACIQQNDARLADTSKASYTADVASIATCLYTGIMSDSGSFRFPRTTPQLFRTAADLVEMGADPVAAYENTFNVDSFERSRLLGNALATMQLHHDGRLCTLAVSMADIERYGCTASDTEGFVHHTLSISGVLMGILFVELADQVKCSFRSKGDVYVRDLAAQYGGGGHVYAAGARIKGMPLSDVVTTIVERAKLSLP